MTFKLPFWPHIARAHLHLYKLRSQSKVPIQWLYAPHKSVYCRAPRILRHRGFQSRTLFTSSPCLRRKQVIIETSCSQDAEDKDASSQANVNDFSAYHQAIAAAHEQLRVDLSRVKVGGTARDLEAIEKIRVRLKKNGNGAGGDVTITDIASVVPRGKAVHVMVGEKDHVKHVLSALLKQPENLNVVQSPTDPLTVMISIPPVTQDARAKAADVASHRGTTALSALKESRGIQKKRLRSAELSRQAGPDQLRRTEKELEKINEKAVAETKRMVEECKRRLLGT